LTRETSDVTRVQYPGQFAPDESPPLIDRIRYELNSQTTRPTERQNDSLDFFTLGQLEGPRKPTIGFDSKSIKEIQATSKQTERIEGALEDAPRAGQRQDLNESEKKIADAIVQDARRYRDIAKEIDSNIRNPKLPLMAMQQEKEDHRNALSEALRCLTEETVGPVLAEVNRQFEENKDGLRSVYVPELDNVFIGRFNEQARKYTRFIDPRIPSCLTN
jgi:hypothetical protein